MKRVSIDTAFKRINGKSGTVCATNASLAFGFSSAMFSVYWYDENDLCIKDPACNCYIAIDRKLLQSIEEIPCDSGGTEFEFTAHDGATITVDIAAENIVHIAS